MPRPRLSLLSLAVCAATIAACSNDQAPDNSLTLARTYHLVSIDGKPLPFLLAADSIDSGHVIRRAADTVFIDQFHHTPSPTGGPPSAGVTERAWLASQTGSIIVLGPAGPTGVDTAFLGGDSLSLHEHAFASTPHVNLYVAP